MPFACLKIFDVPTSTSISLVIRCLSFAHYYLFKNGQRFTPVLAERAKGQTKLNKFRFLGVKFCVCHWGKTYYWNIYILNTQQCQILLKYFSTCKSYPRIIYNTRYLLLLLTFCDLTLHITYGSPCIIKLINNNWLPVIIKWQSLCLLGPSLNCIVYSVVLNIKYAL